MFVPLGIDLAHTGLDEFKEPEFPPYGPKAQENNSEKQADELPQSTKEQKFVKFVPEIKPETKPEVKTEVKVEVKHVPKEVKQEYKKPVRNNIRYAEMYRSVPRGNQRNWNFMKS